MSDPYHPDQYHYWTSDWAIDGRYPRTGISPESCLCCSGTSGTSGTTEAGGIKLDPWWMLDLGMKYPVKYILLIGRSEGRQLNGFSLSVKNSTTPSTSLTYSNNGTNTFIADVDDVLAQQIIINTTGFMTLCEVRIIEGDCNNGMFGDECLKHCHCADGMMCNRSIGTCKTPGCIVGWQGGACDTECTNNTFGEECRYICHCKDDKQCDTVSGNCTDNTCAPGYTGTNCSLECEDGTFGDCFSVCHCFGKEICETIYGLCPGNCSAGYKGRQCTDKCRNNTYGENCRNQCHCENHKQCDIYAGNCTDDKCEPGFRGVYCNKAVPLKQTDIDATSPSTTIAIGVSAAVLVVVIIVVGVVFFLRRKGIVFAKRGPKRQQDNNFASLEDNTVKHKTETKDNTVKHKTETSFQDTQNPKYKPKDNSVKHKAESKHPRYIADESEEHAYETADVKNDYYSFSPREADIKVHQLWNYIRNNMQDTCKPFFKEFTLLKQGLVDTHKVALENREKNRYKEMFAYDHSRVPLAANCAGESEYINACFIDGYEKAAKFIASQGPTKEMIDDFWRMVWQQKSDRIVMLTNLVEFGSHKCKQYWPEEGETSFGKITVELLNTETSLDYVIRHLQIKEGNESPRSVTQYHFKSWPDKDVPDSAWCLVNFWRIVINHPSTKDAGPIVVHCSAGVGRTGTFIALDTLYNQADNEGCVRPLQMVETLRRQRVNMVQTKEQFVYLHEAVAEALLFGTHYAWSKQFPDIHKYMTQKDPKTKTMRLELQFQLIVDSLSDVPEPSTSASSDAEYSNVKTIVSEIDAYRPKRKNKNSRYIEELDAMYLPNFKKANALLVAISPSEKTSNEFWSLIDEHNVKTIIVLSESSSASYKTNSNLGTKYNPKFDVNFMEEKKRKGFTEKTLTFKESEKDEEELTTVKQFTYTAWKDDCIVPGDTHSMVDLLKAVHMWQPHLSDSQPILLHCGDGKKRCGLVCVLINELHRMRMDDGHVNVVESVKTMKQRNRDVVPNVEQFKYCYDVILEQIKQTNVGEVYQNL